MSRIRNLSVAVRLGGAFGAVCLACLIVALVGARGVGDAKTDMKIATDGSESMRVLGEVSQAIALDARDLTRHLYVHDGDLAEQDKIAKGMAARQEHAVKAIAGVAKIHPDDAALFAEFSTTGEAFGKAVATALKQSRQETVDGVEERDGSRTTYLEQVVPAQEALDGALADIKKKVGADVDTEIARGLTEADSTRRFVLIVGALAVLLGAGLAVVITRTITRPVQRIVATLASLRDICAMHLTDGLRHMAEGDLTYDVKPATKLIGDEAKDELGEVSRSVDSIRNRFGEAIAAYDGSRAGIREILDSVTASATMLSSASAHMRTSSEEAGRAVGEIALAVGDVAQGAERQVRSVEEAKLATEQVGQATEDSARSAQETAVAAAEARQVAEEGEHAVAQATAAMRQVRESSAQVSDVMHGLGAKSEQIGGIVDTITGIAEQTNLLALNAAIEAARAGEQGRGFAVVAEEVRKLAEESQSAARSISGLVEEIQTETAQAVTVVEATAIQTEEGAATVEQARDAFSRIGASVEDMSGRVDAIAAAVQQIAASAQKVQADMAEVAAVAEESSASSEEVSASTQQTSASAQEIASSASELAKTAEELELLVGRFTLTV